MTDETVEYQYQTTINNDETKLLVDYLNATYYYETGTSSKYQIYTTYL